MSIDLIVLGFYMVIVLSVGFLFSNKTGDSKNYFAGGGMMLWWMIGATTFMTQFSAWTFTGAAGKVFNSGFLTVSVLFFGNAVAFFLASLFFAEKFRQLRVVTPIEAVRKRYGPVNEQVFTWLQVPMGVIEAGIWLNGLAIFASAIFGISIPVMVTATGVTVVIMSVVGGSWAVVASDFVQMLVVMAVSVVTCVFAYFYIGGPTAIFDKYPHNIIFGDDVNHIWMFVVWFALTFLRMIFSNNHMGQAIRYLSAKDTKNAKKGARFAAFLMFCGPFLWFLPPMVAGTIYTEPQMKEMYSALGSHYLDAAYLAFVQTAMPVGMVGLMMSAVFAATMSSMDTGINRNSGVIIRNFYLPVIKKGQASERELVWVGKLVSVGFGIIVISFGQFIASIKTLSLFDLMLQVQALISLPITIPLFWTILVKRVPSWAPWATVVFGGFMSILIKTYVTPDNLVSLFGIENMTKREGIDVVSTSAIFANIFLCSGFFFATKLFYKESDVEHVAREKKFFDDVNTPVVNDTEESTGMSFEQGNKMGKLALIYGVGILLLFFVPQESFILRFAFVGVAAIVIGAGLFLLHQSKTYRDRQLIHQQKLALGIDEQVKND